MKAKTNGKIQIVIGIVLIIFAISWGIYFYTSYIKIIQDTSSGLATSWADELNKTGVGAQGHVLSSLTAVITTGYNFIFMFPILIVILVALGVKFILDGLAMLEE